MKARAAFLFVTASLLLPALGSAQIVEYYSLDAIGNVRVVTDQQGKVIERHDYLPFGEECTTGPCANNPGFGAGQSRKFTGKERDAESGLDYFGARYYGAKTGRFTTIDPVYTWNENLLDPQRWNRYAYVRNNPLRYVDPDGRAIETPWDVLNVGIGVVSFGANVAAGNAGGAALDAAGLVYDVAATAVPGLPGGAGTLIKAARVADKAGDVAKTVALSRKVHGEAAEHAAEALAKGLPDVLTVSRGGAPANRAASIGGRAKVPGKHLDEYPPAMFKEGGAGASVRPINPRDNMSAGACIGNACRGLADGSRVRIKVEDK